MLRSQDSDGDGELYKIKLLTCPAAIMSSFPPLLQNIGPDSEILSKYSKSLPEALSALKGLGSKVSEVSVVFKY